MWYFLSNLTLLLPYFISHLINLTLPLILHYLRFFYNNNNNFFLILAKEIIINIVKRQAHTFNDICDAQLEKKKS